MSGKSIISNSYLEDIGDAIRYKKGTEETFYPSQMGDAIRSIEGIVPTGTMEIDANGVYDVTEKASVDVDVNPDLRPLSVSENGTYEPDGFDGFSRVTVSTYTAEDEGKVLHNGHFVTQDSETITVEDDTTVDTTLIGSLSVDVTSPLQRANLANADDVAEGYLNSNGILLQDPNTKPITTGYIDVSGSTDGKIYIIAAMNMSTQVYSILGYDENKQRIGSQRVNNHMYTTSIGYIDELAIPSGAKYVRMSFNAGGESVFAVLLSNPMQVLGETLGWTKFKYTT